MKKTLAAAALAWGLGTALAQTTAYQQKYRPQVHFSPQRNWTNDPNGLVYFKGEYHLFYQFNPFGDEWGHMSWGHAVSTDLLHWQELPVAIPEADGVMIFTGSIVVDTRNTSGLCVGGAGCLVAVYTGHSDDGKGNVHQAQNLASSQDAGRTWTKYAGNPVLDLHMADFRDPSVSWNEQAQAWVMAVSLPKEHKVRFYRSADLKQWSALSDFGPAGDIAGDWECPDLLPLPDARGKASGMWALKVGLNPGALQGGSGEQYMLGRFDGKTFTQSPARGSMGWTNYGKDDYCAISYNGLPEADKPVLIGWMSNWEYAAKQPTSPWRGQMSLARRLSLVEDKAGMALRQEPVVAPLRQAAHAINATATGQRVAATNAPYEIDVDFGTPAAGRFGLRLYTDKEHWTDIGFDKGKAEFYIDRSRSSVAVAREFPVRTAAPLATGRAFSLQLVVDRSSVEAYAQDGTIAMTDLVFPVSEGTQQVEFFAEGGSARVTGTMWELASIWR